MTRRAVAVALSVFVVGCDNAPAVDPALVDVLTELHLADARAALDSSETRRAALAESLRAVALDAHDLDSVALGARLDALAADADLARATYDSVEAMLVRERQGPAPDSIPPYPGS